MLYSCVWSRSGLGEMTALALTGKVKRVRFCRQAADKESKWKVFNRNPLDGALAVGLGSMVFELLNVCVMILRPLTEALPVGGANKAESPVKTASTPKRVCLHAAFSRRNRCTTAGLLNHSVLWYRF